MKKYLFLAEKPSIARLCRKVYEDNKGKFDFEATFIGFTSCGWSKFDKVRFLNDFEGCEKIDVSSLELPNVFYILGYDRLKTIANEIDLSEYDEIVSIVDPDIYGAILINEFAKLKGLNTSFFKAIALCSLEEKDVLEAFDLMINCKDFVRSLVNEFKENLYIVNKTIFFFDSLYKIVLYNGDLVLLNTYNNGKYFLTTDQFELKLDNDKMEKFKILECLRKY